jgi:hypothetical protein
MSDTIDVSFRRRNEIIQSIREAESLDAAEKIVDGLERNGWLIMHPNALLIRTQLAGLSQELATATRKLEEARKDEERLDWMMHKITGKALREMGVITSGNCDRKAIDQAIEQGKGGDDA